MEIFIALHVSSESSRKQAWTCQRLLRRMAVQKWDCSAVCREVNINDAALHAVRVITSYMPDNLTNATHLSSMSFTCKMRSPSLQLSTHRLPRLFIIAVRLQSLHDKPIRETPNGSPPHEVSVKRGAKLGVIQRNSWQDKSAVVFAVTANLQTSCM